MKELKILHLYSDLLDLYGDYTNVTAVRRAAAQLGYESAVTEVQLGEPIDPAGYDFIYIGHGKARNLAAAAPHFRQYVDAITAAVENGTVFLVTGNALSTALPTSPGKTRVRSSRCCAAPATAKPRTAPKAPSTGTSSAPGRWARYWCAIPPCCGRYSIASPGRTAPGWISACRSVRWRSPWQNSVTCSNPYNTAKDRCPAPASVLFYFRPCREKPKFLPGFFVKT